VLGRDACPEECIGLEIQLNVIGHYVKVKKKSSPTRKIPSFLALPWTYRDGPPVYYWRLPA
jgi:hypothetical protein